MINEKNMKIYIIEYLNTINLSNLSSYELKFKIDVIVILLYNLNEQLLTFMNDEDFTFYNVDKVMNDEDAEIYIIEYLNMINLSNLPSHELKLKIGASVILLRNLILSIELCNRTRLHIARIS